ncbi:MAG: glycosyltransferase [Saprospiraceae bacterium]
MHILFLPSWFETPAHPTAGKAIKDLVFALSQYSLVKGDGHKFNILFQSNEDVQNIQYLDHGIEVWHSEVVTRGKLFPLWNIVSLKRYQSVLERYILKQGTPDLLHVHGYPALAVAVNIFNKKNIPFIYTEHSSKVAQEKLSGIERRLIRRYSRLAVKTVAVGTNLAKRLSTVIDREVQVIPNTINFNLFTTSGLKNPGQWMMINLLNKNKQVDLGIKAFNLYAQTNKNASLHIIGDGQERSALEELIKSLPSGNRIKMYGEKHVDQWLSILQSSIGLLCMSRFETFGVVVLEALACAVPVISFNNMGITDLLSPEDIILLPPNSNLEAVANAMISIDSEQKSLTPLRNKLASKFDYPQVADVYVSVYRAAIKKFSH